MNATVTEITRSDLKEFVSVAAEFARAVPGKQALDLDACDPETLSRCWLELCAIGLDRCLLGESAGAAGVPDAAIAPLVGAIATGDGGLALLMLSSNLALASLEPEAAAAVPTRARWAYVPAGDEMSRASAPPVFRHGRLSGSVRLALGAADSDGYVVAASEDGRPVLVALERSAESLIVRPLGDQLGLRGARAAELTFGDSPARRIGDQRSAERMNSLLLTGVAAIARAVAARAGELALEYAENRYQGGGPIIMHGAVRDMLARIAERNVALSAEVDPAAPLDLATALAAKIVATDMAVESTIDAVQVFGGMGYMHETGVEKLMRDAKYCQLYPSANWIARERLLETQRQAGNT